jgi:hypothetical protein
MTDSYVRHLLSENEKILLTSRQHWLLLVGAIFLETIFILLILIGVTVAVVTFSDYPIIGTGYILLIIPIISMLKDILEWLNHQYLITNRRVMQVAGVFNKSVIDSSLEKVNDVKMVQSFFGRIFNFGDIEILTASELGTNLFRQIGDPVMFKTSMLNAKERLSDDGSPLHYAASVPVMIEEMDQLRRRGIITEDEFQNKKRELLSKL